MFLLSGVFLLNVLLRSVLDKDSCHREGHPALLSLLSVSRRGTHPEEGVATEQEIGFILDAVCDDKFVERRLYRHPGRGVAGKIGATCVAPSSTNSSNPFVSSR